MSRSAFNRRPRWVPALVGVIAVGYLLVIVGLPVGAIVYHALALGTEAFWNALTEDETIHALKLTLAVIAIAVPMNTVFGLAAAWVLARHKFFGKGALAALVNLPIALAPTIAGLFIVLLYSPRKEIGLLARPINAINEWLIANPSWQQFLHIDQVQILFAFPSLVLATVLVTMPMVALEVLPTLEQTDPTEAQAARTLGANGWQTFWRVVLPAIRWSVLYGVILCLAKAAGEFGAVSAVSGRLIGETNTLTLHIERSYAEAYGPEEEIKAYAPAVVLLSLAVFTLLVSTVMNLLYARQSAGKTVEAKH